MLQNALGGETGCFEKFERLIERHRALLRRLCAGQTRSKEDAEDLEGIVVETALKQARRFDPDRAAFGTWLGKIVRNEASDMRRRAARRPPCLPSDEFTEAEVARAVAPEPQPEMPECQALEQLPYVLRTAFTLVKLRGLSSKEAAEAMNTTDGTVRTYVWKARQLLIEALTGQEAAA